MSQRDADRFSADAAPVEEIAALKELERRSRDRGASTGIQGYLRSTKLTALHLRADARTYLRYLSPRKGETVLDAGAGVGRMAMLVAPKVSRLVCVDLSDRALEALFLEAKDRGICNIETVQADLSSLPRSIGQFNRVYCVDVLQLIPSHRERLAAVRNLHEVLKPGGLCVISVSCWNYRTTREGGQKEGICGTGEGQMYCYHFTPCELKFLLHEAGFSHIRLRGLRILPGRLVRHLPASFSILETWLSMVPVLSGAGRVVIAIGVR